MSDNDNEKLLYETWSTAKVLKDMFDAHSKEEKDNIKHINTRLDILNEKISSVDKSIVELDNSHSKKINKLKLKLATISGGIAVIMSIAISWVKSIIKVVH